VIDAPITLVAMTPRDLVPDVHGMPTTRMKRASESAAAGAGVTTSGLMHRRRLMNLCIGLFFALRRVDWALNLFRFASKPVHVGPALREQWNSWEGAEAFAAPPRAIKPEGVRQAAEPPAQWCPGIPGGEGASTCRRNRANRRQAFTAAVAPPCHSDEDGLEAL
jgi:hypothetical protein